MCCSYPEEVGENRFMWCCGAVERVKRRDDKVITVDIKQDGQFIARGEIEETEEILNISLWNSETPKKEAWGQDM